MCDFISLSTRDEGFILRCRSCGCYQLGFSTLLLSLNEADFNKLAGYIGHLASNRMQENEWENRQLLVPTPHIGVNMLLSKEQILALSELMAEADNEQIAQSMMTLLSQGA